MGKRLWAACLAAMLLLTGCSPRKPAAENWTVVSQITVTCEHNGTLTRRVYTSQEKMRQILNCLRSLGQKSTPDHDPEVLYGRTFSITLTHTDGSQRFYQTKADRYIRQNRDPWQQADPERISQLNFLLQNLPSDDPQIGLRGNIPGYSKPAFRQTRGKPVLIYSSPPISDSVSSRTCPLGSSPSANVPSRRRSR